MRVRVGRNLTTFPLPGAMTKADRINFEKRMLLAFDALKANPAYGGSVFSMTPNADWTEVTGDEANPNLITQEKYQVRAGAAAALFQLIRTYTHQLTAPPPSCRHRRLARVNSNSWTTT